MCQSARLRINARMGSLEKLLATRAPLGIRGGRIPRPRLVGDGFLLPGNTGFIWLDAGWAHPLNSGRSWHRVDGAVVGSGPWKIGDSGSELFLLTPADSDLVEDWEIWSEFLRSERGLECTRARAREFLSEIYDQ